MKKWMGCLGLVMLLTVTASATSSFQGFEIDTGDWVFDDAGAQSGRVASGEGILGVSSASGDYHLELVNVHDNYQAGYGTAGYSYFGGKNPVYEGSFYQAVDVYLDPTWSGLGFWIDMSPADVDGSSLYAAEGNFRLTGDGSSVAVQAIDGPVLTSITTPGWYSFEMAWSKGATPTDLIQIDLTVYDSLGTPLGSDTRLAEFPYLNHPGQSQYLGGNSYVWFTVWQNGFADDVIAVDNVRTGLTAVVVPAPGAVLLAGMGVSLVTWLRRRRTL